MAGRKITTRTISDGISETYVAESNGEKMEIYYSRDSVNGISQVSIWWKHYDDIPRSLLEIVEQQGVSKRRAEREAKSILKSRPLSSAEVDSERLYFSFDEEANVVLRLLLEARDFKELVAVVIGAQIVKLTRERTLESALLRGEVCSPYKYGYYRYYFKKYLDKVSKRYYRKYREGAFPRVEEEGGSLLKLTSKSRAITKIVTIPYCDGHFNLKVMRSSSRMKNSKNMLVEIVTSPCNEYIYLQPKDVKTFIMAFSSLESLREAEAFAEMLDLIAWFRIKESWDPLQKQPLMELPGESPDDAINKVVEEYVRLLKKYPSMLGKIPFYQEYPNRITEKIKERMRGWENILNFIDKYCDKNVLQEYFAAVASLAIEVKDVEILKKVLPYLPPKYRTLVRDGLIIDSMTARRKTYVV